MARSQALVASETVQLVHVDRLRPWEKNPRSITVERFQALKKALSSAPAMMRARPTIALAGVDYAEDGTTIAGNMRLRAAQELVAEGDEAFLAEFPGGQVPAYLVNIDEDEAREWALRDNNPYGGWDDEALHEFVHQLAESGRDLDLTGFPDGDVQLILEGVGPRNGGGGNPFKAVDDDLPAEYVCPGCGYEWSGNPKPGVTDEPPVQAR